MIPSLKKIFFATVFNLFLFLFLMIGIQNSQTKNKVNLLFNETIDLPVSFIIGISFISGSVFSIFFSINSNRELK